MLLVFSFFFPIGGAFEQKISFLCPSQASGLPSPIFFWGGGGTGDYINFVNLCPFELFDMPTSTLILHLDKSSSPQFGTRVSPQAPGGVLPSNGLLGMCCWMGLHFHDLTDYNGVVFSSIFNRVTRMGSHIFGTWRVRKLFAQK